MNALQYIILFLTISTPWANAVLAPVSEVAPSAEVLLQTRSHQIRTERWWSLSELWPFADSWHPFSALDHTVLWKGVNVAPDPDLHIPLTDRVQIARVEIYYEASCPFSLSFINQTLRAAWEDAGNLSARMNVKLYPFGNARDVPEKYISKGYHFWHPNATYPITLCQHGEKECRGNLIQACAIDSLKDPRHYVPYVICMASYSIGTSFEQSSYECGKKLDVDMYKVKTCAESAHGKKLITSADEATRKTFEKMNAPGVPFIVVQGRNTNGKLLEPICSWLREPRPATCRNSFMPIPPHGFNADCGNKGGGKC